MNPFCIYESCIKIAKTEALFKQYRMALNQENYYIEVPKDDAINHNQFFHFMLRTFNRLDGLYLCERCLLIDAIIKDKIRKKNSEETRKLNRGKSPEIK